MVAIGDRASVGLHACSASHGNKEFCDLVIVSTLAGPDVVGVVNLLEALSLFFGVGVLAGIACVFEFHDSSVDLAQLLILGVGGLNNVFDRVLDGRAGSDEFITRLGPAFGLILPELCTGAIGGVVEKNAVREAGDRRHKLFRRRGGNVVHIQIEDELAIHKLRGRRQVGLLEFDAGWQHGAPGDGVGELVVT